MIELSNVELNLFISGAPGDPAADSFPVWCAPCATNLALPIWKEAWSYCITFIHHTPGNKWCLRIPSSDCWSFVSYPDIDFHKVAKLWCLDQSTTNENLLAWCRYWGCSCWGYGELLCHAYKLIELIVDRQLVGSCHLNTAWVFLCEAEWGIEEKPAAHRTKSSTGCHVWRWCPWLGLHPRLTAPTFSSPQHRDESLFYSPATVVFRKLFYLQDVNSRCLS